MKVLLLVSKVYNETEFWTCLGILKKHNVEFDICSLAKSISNDTGTECWNVKHFEDVQAEEYDGLIVMSNMGAGLKAAHQMWYNEGIKELVLKFKDKPAASVCCAAPTIRYLADGKKVSFYNLGVVRDLMVDAGAIPTKESLTVDDGLVTAQNEQVSNWWMETFVAVVKGEEVPQFVKGSWKEVRKHGRMTDKQYEKYLGLSSGDKRKVQNMRRLYPDMDADEIYKRLGVS